VESPLINVPSESSVQSGVLISEPVMRIGVLIVDQETDWQVEIQCDSPWNLVDGEFFYDFVC
ncbi:MAG: hypothetical protein AAB873_00475, partial [Patescibacteria group bacterium]